MQKLPLSLYSVKGIQAKKPGTSLLSYRALFFPQLAIKPLDLLLNIQPMVRFGTSILKR